MTHFDPGLQPERTRMAWRRTLFGLTVIALGALRLLPQAAGTVGVLLSALALSSTAALWWVIRRRNHKTDGALARGDATLLPGGATLAVVTGTAVVMGACGLVLVAATALR